MKSPGRPSTRREIERLFWGEIAKGTDLSRWSGDELAAIATVLNSRPRKILGWKTPAEALNDHLRSAQASVATTG